jgi:ferredoxin-NADP reductase
MTGSAPTAGAPAGLRRAELRLEAVWDESHDTKSFRFAAPLSGLPRFLAGQFYAVEIPTKDGGSVRRSYSIASSPLERGHFDLAVKYLEGGAGSAALFGHLKVGELVRVSGPFGEFTLEAGRPPLFVAGGVGITPILSMLRQLDAERSPLPVRLLFSNRERRDLIFERELRAMEGRHPNFRFRYALTRERGAVESWFLRGRFDGAALALAIAGLDRPVAYLCGPNEMMEAAGKALLALGLPRADIRTEAFMGTGPAF